MEDNIKLDLDEVVQILENLQIIDSKWQCKPEPTTHFIWLAVDSNGNERMTTCKAGFQRFSPKLYHSSRSLNKEIREAALKERHKICSYDDTQMKDDHWIEMPDERDMGKWGSYPTWSYLPGGTIKKLIGKDLTWDDEPVKYEG